jgi:hypothetical protein
VRKCTIIIPTDTDCVAAPTDSSHRTPKLLGRETQGWQTDTFTRICHSMGSAASFGLHDLRAYGVQVFWPAETRRVELDKVSASRRSVITAPTWLGGERNVNTVFRCHVLWVSCSIGFSSTPCSEETSIAWWRSYAQAPSYQCWWVFSSLLWIFLV